MNITRYLALRAVAREINRAETAGDVYDHRRIMRELKYATPDLFSEAELLVLVRQAEKTLEVL